MVSLSRFALAEYGKAIRTAPREVIFNRSLILSALLYAMSAIPATWDQGSASVVPSLPGFQHQFGLTSGANAKEIRNFISLVYIGYAAGAAGSFLINDRVGRLWSFRVYIVVWTVGQMIATFAAGKPALYASRIVSGIGIGALTVTGPISIVEIAPAEIRGLLTAWFNVAMGISLLASTLCVLGVFEHIQPGKLQYQVVFFSPCVYMFLLSIGSFFLCESPRWLILVGRREEGLKTLVRLRGLPADNPRVQREIEEIENQIHKEQSEHSQSIAGIIKETFTVPSNLRRVQQTLVSYGLAQLSGANSITSYLIPILRIVGVGGGTSRSLLLSSMYALSKFCFTLIASFFFIDALGRRKSLFIGITLQLISDVYVGVFIKFNQEGSVSSAASSAAVAWIYIHAFGYAVGLLILPYVFGAELWPNRIRSFGAAFSACFHWLFIYAFQFALPSLLADTDNWGAFIFFAAWCSIAIVYVYLMVPETSGLSVEEIDDVFKGPWFNARKRAKRPTVLGRDVDAAAEDKCTAENVKVSDKSSA